MSDYYVALIYALFILMGFTSPFVSSLGYVWVDTFYPQYVSLVLKGVPVALIMGATAIGSYVLLDRRSPPRLTSTMVLSVVMSVWLTLTTIWAAVPDQAWLKWDWAFKTVLFTAFIPFVIRSRVQIEAFIQVYVFAAAIHIVSFGIKGMLSGGGYGIELGFLKTNVGIGEGSALSGIALMFIPLLLHLRKHSLIIPTQRQRTVLYLGYIIPCCTAPIATYARTAIVGFAVLGSLLWLQSRHKLITAGIVVVTAVALFLNAPEGWKNRISTIETYDQEKSAYTRLMVWTWTFDYVSSHPLGGGFNVYVINHIETLGEVQDARAFHSAYFEVLGEQGWPGIAIFLTVILTTIVNLRRVSRRTRDSPELEWCGDLTRAVLISFLVILSVAAFVGIAFQPEIWYLVALTNCISEYVRRAQAPAQIPRWAPHPGVATPGAATAEARTLRRYRRQPPSAGSDPL